MNSKKKVDKHFVSAIDKRLAEFNKHHPRTPSEQAEINKYKKIYRLRDKKVSSE